MMKRMYGNVMNALPLELSLSIQFFRHHGRFPSLSNPQSFSEKIQARKVRGRDPRYPILADKYKVKEHIRSILGDEWNIPTLWVGDKLPPISERTWACPFVIKATHSSGQNIFVRSEGDVDWVGIESRVNSWLGEGLPKYIGEWHYSEIKPAIIVEPFIGNGESLPVDYKFFCFGGRVHFIQVDVGRGVNHMRAFYSADWKKLPFGLKHPVPVGDVRAPASLGAMILGAEKLAAEFDFVRIDFYEVGERPLFGEITFFPGSGYERFSPPRYDLEFGRIWSEGVGRVCAVAAQHTAHVPGPAA